MTLQEACYPEESCHSPVKDAGAGISYLPCSSTTKHQCNGIPSQNTSQAGKVGVTVRRFLAYAFVHLYLQERGRGWSLQRQSRACTTSQQHAVKKWRAVLQMKEGSQTTQTVLVTTCTSHTFTVAGRISR